MKTETASQIETANEQYEVLMPVIMGSEKPNTFRTVGITSATTLRQTYSARSPARFRNIATGQVLIRADFA